MTANGGTRNRWTVIAGALIVQIILGTVYAFSVFVRPLEAEFGWDRTTTQWAFSLALATFAVTMIPAGRLQDRLGPRRVATHRRHPPRTVVFCSVPSWWLRIVPGPCI